MKKARTDFEWKRPAELAKMQLQLLPSPPARRMGRGPRCCRTLGLTVVRPTRSTDRAKALDIAVEELFRFLFDRLGQLHWFTTAATTARLLRILCETARGT